MSANLLPFGVSQFTTWPQTFEEDIALYAETGVRYIEVCESKLDPNNPIPQLEILKASGLQLASVQPRLHSLFPDFPRPEPKSPRERMGHLRKTIELFGAHFPGATLVSISGAAPNGDYKFAYETAAHEYSEIAKIASDNGVRIALEPLNPILMNVDTFLCSLPHALNVIEEVDHDAFGLWLDVWHIWEDTAAPATIQAFGDKIFGVHINDWKPPRAFGDRFLPGDGDIPLLELLKAVHSTGYEGSYTLEIFSESKFPDSLWRDPRRTVVEGKKAFESIWKEICA